jgi:hypothetical protein
MNKHSLPLNVYEIDKNETTWEAAVKFSSLNPFPINIIIQNNDNKFPYGLDNSTSNISLVKNYVIFLIFNLLP